MLQKWSFFNKNEQNLEKLVVLKNYTRIECAFQNFWAQNLKFMSFKKGFGGPRAHKKNGPLGQIFKEIDELSAHFLKISYDCILAERWVGIHVGYF